MRLFAFGGKVDLAAQCALYKELNGVSAGLALVWRWIPPGPLALGYVRPAHTGERVEPFTGNIQRLLRSDDHFQARSAIKYFGDQAGALGEMLNIIQYQQELFALQKIEQLLACRYIAIEAKTNGLGDGRDEPAHRRHCLHRHRKDPIREGKGCPAGVRLASSCRETHR